MNFFIFIIIFNILSIITSSPPPIPQPHYQTFIETPIVQIDDNQKSSLKNLEEIKIISESTNVNVYFTENERIEEHRIKITPLNLESGLYFPGTSFSQIMPDGKILKLNSNFCEKDSIPEGEKDLEKNKCTAEFIENGQEYKFKYNFILRKDEHIIITYNISIIKESKEILYKQESVSVSSVYKTGNCTFKFIIPDYYTNLGLKNNLLEKKSDRVYAYEGECPSEVISEVIRYAPNQSFWKAQVNIYCSSSSKISKYVNLTFPRYYRGGKNKNKNYKITLYDNTKLKESELIKDETFLKVTVPGKNNTKIGVNLKTAFSNVLREKFDVYPSENYYQIEGNIDEVIKAKVQEIINNSSSQYKDYPDYYKIGKFVFSYMTYDLSYHGKEKTALEIYNEKRGVCEHYTILYNAMLNSIGIKTLNTFGWAFSNDETSANQDSIGHAWTVALIDNNWIELDATWDLFEGIPHIFEGFKKGSYSYLSYEKVELEFTKNINLVDNLDDEEDDELIISSIKDSIQANESTIIKSNIITQINSTVPKIINSIKINESTIIRSNIITQINTTIPKIINSIQINESTILKSNIIMEINSTVPKIINSIQTNESTILKSNIISQINSSSSIINQTSLINNLNSSNIDENSYILNSSLPIINYNSNINNTIIPKTFIKSELINNKTIKISTKSSNIISGSIINGGTTSINHTHKINYDSIIKRTTILENNSVKSNIISTIPNKKKTNNITYASEISSTLNYTETPRVIYTIFILQIQLINNFIRIYILSDFPIKKSYSLNLISKLYYQNLRNLQQEEGKDTIITLYAIEDFDKDKIAVFSSNNEFNNIKRVEGQEVRSNNIGNNYANIILLDNNKDCLDTEKVENKIKQGGLDYSNLPSDYKISQYKINSASQGCNFNLESNLIINEENKQIKLNFINDKSGDVNTSCILSKNNEKANLIPCTLNKNVDSNYILEDYIQSNNKETLTIIQSNKSRELYLNCSLKLKKIYYKDSEKGGLKTGVLIFLIIFSILLFLGIIFLAIYFKNKTKIENLDNNKTNSNYIQSFSSSATSCQL